jgi:hypothetical protein
VHVNDSTNTNPANIQIKILDGSQLVDFSLQALNDTADSFVSFKLGGIFKATTTSVEFDVIAITNCTIDVDNGGQTTWASIEELNNYDDETTDFT